MSPKKFIFISMALLANIALASSNKDATETKVIEAPKEKEKIDNRPVPEAYGTKFMDDRLLYESTKGTLDQKRFGVGIDTTENDSDSERLRKAQEEHLKKQIAEDEAKNPPPKEHKDGFQVDKTRIIGDDRVMGKEKYDTGLTIKSKIGESAGELHIDNSGNAYILKDKGKAVDANNSKLHRTQEEYDIFEEKRKKLNELNEKARKTENEDERKSIEREAKKLRDSIMNSGDTSIQSLSDFAFKGTDPFSQGQGTVDHFRMQNQKLIHGEHEGWVRFNDMEMDKNASKLYNELYGIKPFTSDAGQITKVHNYGVLTQAYDMLPTLQKQLTDRMQMPIIKCQISRELLPAFFCPIDGKGGARFPGKMPTEFKDAANLTTSYTDAHGNKVEIPVNEELASLNSAAIAKKTNLQRAQEACNSYCFNDPKDHSCVSEKKISKKKINVPNGSIIKVFPDYSADNTSLFMDLDDSIPIKHLSFDLKINRTLIKKDGMDETALTNLWRTFLKEAFFKMRYSILEIPEDEPNGRLHPITIVDRAVLHLTDDTIKITVPIDKNIKKLQIKMWKPYIHNSPLFQHEYEKFFTQLKDEWGGTITIENMEAEYVSDSWYYCSFKQLVGSPLECAGGNYKKIKYGSGGGNFLYLCLASRYKIGPEVSTGAFYDEDSCKRSCVYHEKCLPTYDHYKGNYGDEASIFKAEVDCVDDPTNTKCTKKKCEELFKDYEKTPINEMIVHNDNTMQYTVKLRQVTGKPVRPKIDIQAELGNTAANKEQREEMLNREQKDAAYQYMIQNLTLNRVKQAIGEESPMKLASKFEDTNDQIPIRTVEVELKPKSFDYNSGVYNIYLVARMDQKYSPKYGSYYYRTAKGITVHTNPRGNTMYLDHTYLIRKPGDTPSWQVFRKDEFAQVLTLVERTVVNPNGSVSQRTDFEWVASHQTTDDRNYFGEYRLGIGAPDFKIGSFIKMSPSNKATPFAVQSFNPSNHYFSYIATKNEYADMFSTPGAGIWGQLPRDNESRLEKVLAPGKVPENARDKGIISNIWMFLIYSKNTLTYDEIMKMIEGDHYANPGLKKDPVVDNKWVVYSNNRKVRPNHVDHDGELLNGKNPYIMGKPANTSVNVEWEPSISEQGKKMFRFLFIYDDEFSDLGKLGGVSKESGGGTVYSPQKFN
ncbi:hypothetical protein ACPF04_06330 [Campylobacter sp. MOP51]|uniref:hypothetical protein n=1 Tax=Campylobacter canis TaxID=3378588 RepID=UPI003C624724